MDGADKQERVTLWLCECSFRVAPAGDLHDVCSTCKEVPVQTEFTAPPPGSVSVTLTVEEARAVAYDDEGVPPPTIARAWDTGLAKLRAALKEAGE